MTDQEIGALYLKHRRSFLGWAVRTYGLSEEEALDIYQEATVAFVRNVRSGKLDDLLCEPSTYLFAIGRNLALKSLRVQRHAGRTAAMEALDAVAPEHERLEDELHAQHVLAQGMGLLTEKERQVLRLYYFEERSMTDIAQIMGYNNADVAKKMKYVSFRKLAALITKAAIPKSSVHAE
ncbi:MAG: sigma-70 family RNA polymerase sigma factor [Flavobacteriales bacterium]